MRLFACVDLNEEFRAFTCLLSEAGEGRYELRSVESVDGIKELERLPRLVGLQRADEVHFGVWKALAEGGPFACSFLNAVLTKEAVPLFEDGLDARIGLDFRDGDQLDAARGAACLGLGFGDTGGDF